MLVPVDNGADDKIFVSESYDPESHFDATCNDIMQIYKRVTGKDVDLSPPVCVQLLANLGIYECFFAGEKGVEHPKTMEAHFSCWATSPVLHGLRKVVY